jgi:hypothetical protein
MTKEGTKGVWKMLKGMLVKMELMAGNTGSSKMVEIPVGKDKGSKKDT